MMRSLSPHSAWCALRARLGAVLLSSLRCSLLCALLGAAACAALVPAQALAEDTQAVERGVKAAFLFKFLGYVEFPPAADAATAPFVIGVMEADSLAGELVRITAGRSINQRPVQVRVLREGDSLAGVHLLFMGAAMTARAAPLLRSAQQASVLTVTESDLGLASGSVINFRLIDQRVRFEVSLEAAEKSNLKLSSRLLSVAYAVQKGGL